MGGCFTPGGCGALPGGCGAPGPATTGIVSSIHAGIPALARICSTMLPPNNVNARCATVSPTVRAMVALTADCVSGLLLETALEFCRRLISSSRSRGLRIRSSCINVSEKASRICFDVIPHTPPCNCMKCLNSGAKGGSRFAETVTPSRGIIKQYLDACGGKRGLYRRHLPAGHSADHRMKNLHSIHSAKRRL
jgi:hypothetical protein